jgi:hypothetical protein
MLQQAWRIAGDLTVRIAEYQESEENVQQASGRAANVTVEAVVAGTAP